MQGFNTFSFETIFGAEGTARAFRHKAFCTPEELAAGAGHDGVVVILERSHRQYFELDADSIEHGLRLAELWVNGDMKGAITASVWTVDKVGKLEKRMGLVTEPVVFS